MDRSLREIENILAGRGGKGDVNTLLSKDQLCILKRFELWERQKGHVPKTIVQYLRAVRRLALSGGWDLKKTTFKQEHLEKWMEDLLDNLKSPNSRNFNRKMIQTFLKWCLGKKEISDWVNDYLTNESAPNRGREIIFEAGTIERLIQSCEGRTKLRDQTIIALQYDSGARINEVLKVKAGSFTFYPDDTGSVQMPNSKKLKMKEPYRPIALTFSVPYIRRLINSLPDQDPDTPLFQSSTGPSVGKQYTYDGWHMQFKEIIKRTSPIRNKDGKEVKWKALTHALRHNRLTELVANGYHDIGLQIRAGWAQDSQMVKKYIHPSDSQKENIQRQLQGLEVEEKEHQMEGSKLELVECPYCHTKNTPDVRYCLNNDCGRAIGRQDEFEALRAENAELKKRLAELENLAQDTEQTKEGYHNELNLLLDLMSENPEFKPIVEKFKKIRQ